MVVHTFSQQVTTVNHSNRHPHTRSRFCCIFDCIYIRLIIIMNNIFLIAFYISRRIYILACIFLIFTRIFSPLGMGCILRWNWWNVCSLGRVRICRKVGSRPVRAMGRIRRCWKFCWRSACPVGMTRISCWQRSISDCPWDTSWHNRQFLHKAWPASN